MSKNVKIITAVVIVLAVVAALILKQSRGYSIVYLTTKEVYIGKLSTFPSFKLKDAYILQITPDTTDPEKNNFQLQPVKDTVWAPKSIHFLKDSIVFYGPLSPESEISKTLAEQVK